MELRFQLKTTSPVSQNNFAQLNIHNVLSQIVWIKLTFLIIVFDCYDAYLRVLWFASKVHSFFRVNHQLIPGREVQSPVPSSSLSSIQFQTDSRSYSGHLVTQNGIARTSIDVHLNLLHNLLCCLAVDSRSYLLVNNIMKSQVNIQFWRKGEITFIWCHWPSLICTFEIRRSAFLESLSL